MFKGHVVFWSTVAVALTIPGAAIASTFTIDRTVQIQPIQVCDDTGSSCAQNHFYEEQTQQIWGQAGINIEFLQPVKIENSRIFDLSWEVGDLSFLREIAFEGDGAAYGRHPESSATSGPINVWSVNSLNGEEDDHQHGSYQDPLAKVADLGANGMFYSEAASQTQIDPKTGKTFGYATTFAHELGHILGLRHPFEISGKTQPTVEEITNLMSPISLGVDIETIETTDGYRLGLLNEEQSATARSSPFAVSSAGSNDKSTSKGGWSFDSIWGAIDRLSNISNTISDAVARLKDAISFGSDESDSGDKVEQPVTGEIPIELPNGIPNASNRRVFTPRQSVEEPTQRVLDNKNDPNPVEVFQSPTSVGEPDENTGSSAQIDTSNLPDWTQISVSDLGPILSDGCVGELCWKAGTPAEKVLPLSAFNDSRLPEFTIRDVLGVAGIDPEDIPLDKMEFLKNVTLKELVTEYLPFLSDLPLSEAEPILDLISQELGIDGMMDETLGSIVEENLDIGNLSLGDLSNLGDYSITDIKGLADTPLSEFSGDLKIADVLAEDLSFSNMFKDLPSELPIAMADLVLGIGEPDNEADLGKSVTGSNVVGYKKDCSKDSCPHIELNNLPGMPDIPVLGMAGKRWFSWDTPMVPGGSGCLTGMESTGRNPLGGIFKVVLTQVDEASGSAGFSLFFNFSTLCGTSPYVIGPFPAYSVSEGGAVLVGL